MSQIALHIYLCVIQGIAKGYERICRQLAHTAHNVDFRMKYG